jgi:hypothetical protein
LILLVAVVFGPIAGFIQWYLFTGYLVNPWVESLPWGGKLVNTLEEKGDVFYVKSKLPAIPI